MQIVSRIHSVPGNTEFNVSGLAEDTVQLKQVRVCILYWQDWRSEQACKKMACHCLQAHETPLPCPISLVLKSSTYVFCLCCAYATHACLLRFFLRMPRNTPQVQDDWLGRPVRLDKVYSSSATQRQVFRESVLPLVDGLTRGQSGTIVLIGGRRSGKWETLLGPKHEHADRVSQGFKGAQGSILAPGTSPSGVARTARSPVPRSPAAAGPSQGDACKASASGASSGHGLISMILDMLYEHARQVGCASHRFRLSCSACQLAEHAQVNLLTSTKVLALLVHKYKC